MPSFTTSFSNLDQKITDVPLTNLTIIASRPAVGKTILSLDIYKHFLQSQELPVFSLALAVHLDISSQ